MGASVTSILPYTRGRRGAFTRLTRSVRGVGDREFLERVFHKLMLNFTWWVNRKDAEGKNIFQGGFLGLDNIGVFDRSDSTADRRHHRAIRWNQLDGDVYPEPAGDRTGTRRKTIRLTKTSPANSGSTSSISPRP